MLHSSKVGVIWRHIQVLTIIFILTTEINRGILRIVSANLPNRPYAGRIHREDTHA
jgi:hypothetical protein